MVTLPGPVEDLTQTLDSDGRLWLTWTAPKENMAGRPLRTLDHFEVWGIDYPMEDWCAGCPVRPIKLADVPLQAPAPGLDLAPGPYVWESRVRRGRVHVLQVAGFSARGAVHPRAWSKTVVHAVDPPPAMGRFEAAGDDLAVRLIHDPPGPGLEVEIQRLDAQGNVTTLDPAQGAGIDTAVAYGGTYAYRARLVRPAEGTRMPGPWTAQRVVAVSDSLPPPPPGHLDAAAAPEGIRLVWESLAARGDVAGYRLYRRPEDGGAFEPVGGLIRDNFWLDRQAAPGRGWRYRVTAVDDSPAANEGAPSPEAAVYAESPEETEVPAERPDLADPGI
jgi:hypothetical protein